MSAALGADSAVIFVAFSVGNGLLAPGPIQPLEKRHVSLFSYEAHKNQNRTEEGKFVRLRSGLYLLAGKKRSHNKRTD